MTEREFKVGDRVKIIGNTAGHSFNIGDTTVLEELRGGYSDYWETSSGLGYRVDTSDITHADPVPIGYTGKLKDMDLQDGDVVIHTYTNHTVTNGTACGKPFDYWTLDFTLVSRANKWSNWQMSRKDGTYDTSPQREYETQGLPDTDQVTYRWRKAKVKEPVVTTEVFPTYLGKHFYKITVTLTDGVPTSMTGEFL